MLGECLNKIREHVQNWCYEHDIISSVVCDTPGIQGIKIYEKNYNILKSLFEDLMPLLKADNVFLETQKVRGGLLLAFSVKALSESEINNMINQIGEKREPMKFKDKVLNVFTLPINNNTDFNTDALKIAESQYKVASQGMTRANQTGRARNLHNTVITYGGIIKKSKPKSKSKSKPKSKPKTTFESLIKNIFNNSNNYSTSGSLFNSQLSEALDGMATPNDIQPNELFRKFAKALSVLGDQMGIGPLQNQLKSKGINWKQSDDGQAIILFVNNAQTGAPQPIARISAETLTKPSDFEEQLLNMIDFAQGEAPGAFKQKQAEIQNQEKTVREIAKTLNPDPVATQFQGGNATSVAATQAATPKPTVAQTAPQQVM